MVASTVIGGPFTSSAWSWKFVICFVFLNKTYLLWLIGALFRVYYQFEWWWAKRQPTSPNGHNFHEKASFIGSLFPVQLSIIKSNFSLNNALLCLLVQFYLESFINGLFFLSEIEKFSLLRSSHTHTQNCKRKKHFQFKIECEVSAIWSRCCWYFTINTLNLYTFQNFNWMHL